MKEKFIKLDAGDEQTCHFCDFPAEFVLEGEYCGSCGDPLHFCLLHSEAYKREDRNTKDRIIAGGAAKHSQAQAENEGGVDVEVMSNVKAEDIPDEIKHLIGTIIAGLKMIDEVRTRGDLVEAQKMLDQLRKASNGMVYIVAPDIIPKKDDADVTGMTKQ